MDLFEQIQNFKNDIVVVMNKNPLPYEIKVELLQNITTQINLQIKEARITELEHRNDAQNKENTAKEAELKHVD